MDDPPPNFGDPSVAPATKAKKKAPQGTKKPRLELMPEVIAKLDAESAKRRNQRAEAKRKDTVAVARPLHDGVVPSDEPRGCARRVDEHKLLGCLASAVPLPDVVDHAIVVRFPSAKVPSPDPFVGSSEVSMIAPSMPHPLTSTSRRGPAVAAACPSRCKESKADRRLQPPCQQGKEDQMKQYMEQQTKKLEMEEASKKRKIDMEEAARQRQLDIEEAVRQRQLDIEAANATASQRQLDIEAANAATKAKEVAPTIMSVDLSKMSEKTRSWFEARQKEMFDADGLN
ncbi:Serine/threonine-protein kinase mph1 [Hordeum vulgare]|nr:Serine/threonine-protein kinase mph1 [Hordeum vulgare]